MSWNQPPYNPAYGQASGASPSQPYNPGYSPPRGSLPPTASYQQPPPTSSYRQPPSSYGQPPSSYGQPRYGQPPSGYGQPPSGYGQAPSGYRQPPSGYGQSPSGYSGPPPGIDTELWGWFLSVDADRSGKITSSELRQALVNSNWSHFNVETCRLLIGMFDSNSDGAIDIHEFAALWKYVQEWKNCFDRFDKDKSGNIDSSELHQALESFGYRVSVQFCQLCTRVFDRSDQRTMKFDDFIQCCVMLRSLTDSFRRMDTNRSGVIQVSYEQFLEMAIDNTIVQP